MEGHPEGDERGRGAQMSPAMASERPQSVRHFGNFWRWAARPFKTIYSPRSNRLNRVRPKCRKAGAPTMAHRGIYDSVKSSRSCRISNRIPYGVSNRGIGMQALVRIHPPEVNELPRQTCVHFSVFNDTNIFS